MIVKNIETTIVCYRNGAHRFVMNVSEHICTYQIVPIRGTWSWWSCQTPDPIVDSIATILSERIRSYLNGRSDRDWSWHLKLTNRDWLASERNKSYQNVSTRVTSYLNLKLQRKFHDQLRMANRGIRNGSHDSGNLALDHSSKVYYSVGTLSDVCIDSLHMV